MIHCFAYGQSPPTRDPIFILKAGLWFHTWLTANIGQPETHKLFFGGRLWFRTWSRRQRQRPQKRCGIKEHCWTYCQAVHDTRKVETARGRRSVRSPSGDSSCKKTAAHFVMMMASRRRWLGGCPLGWPPWLGLWTRRRWWRTRTPTVAVSRLHGLHCLHCIFVPWAPGPLLPHPTPNV